MAYKALIAKGRKKFPDADSEFLAFALMSNKFTAQVMEKTNESLDPEKVLSSDDFGKLIGLLVRSNLIAMSQEAKWPLVEGDEASMDVDEFLELIHSFRAVADDLLNEKNPDGLYRDLTYMKPFT